MQYGEDVCYQLNVRELDKTILSPPEVEEVAKPVPEEQVANISQISSAQKQEHLTSESADIDRPQDGRVRLGSVAAGVPGSSISPLH